MSSFTDSRRTLLRGDDGNIRTKALAGIVTVMILAGVSALLFVTFNGNGTTSAKHTTVAAGDQSAVGKQTVKSASATPSSTPSSSTAPSTAATSTTKSTAKKATQPASTKRHGDSTSVAPDGVRTITYVVQKGDNLTFIAEWAHQHGYNGLYQANKTVIGRNANLIYPGETFKITIKDGKSFLTHF